MTATFEEWRVVRAADEGRRWGWSFLGRVVSEVDAALRPRGNADPGFKNFVPLSLSQVTENEYHVTISRIKDFPGSVLNTALLVELNGTAFHHPTLRSFCGRLS